MIAHRAPVVLLNAFNRSWIRLGHFFRKYPWRDHLLPEFSLYTIHDVQQCTERLRIDHHICWGCKNKKYTRQSFGESPIIFWPVIRSAFQWFQRFTGNRRIAMILYTTLIKSFKFGSVDFYKVNSYFDICFLKTLETGCWSVLLQWLTFGVTSHMQLLFSAYVDRYDILVKNLSWYFLT